MALCLLVSLLACGSQPDIAAVYLGGETPTLSPEDVSHHPEVVVGATFASVMDIARSPMGIWIDRNAARTLTFEDMNWLRESPRSSYPLVLVGCPNTLYSFRELLSVHGFEGPRVDWEKQVLEPGFSVSILDPEKSGKHQRVYKMCGFTEQPTVSRILTVTDSLLAEM